jgi:hypothetical protein
MGRKYGSRQAAEVTRTIEGPGEPQSVTYPRKTNPSREIVRKNLNNSYDLYDLILSHLLDEGYAETVEAAESIMVNMSEDWRQDIMEISMMHVQLGAHPRPAEVRKAPAKKPSPLDYLGAGATAAIGGAAVTGMARDNRKKPDVSKPKPIFK